MLQNAQILENKKIIDDVYQLTVKGDFKPLAGQFINIKLNNEALLLRRPISVYDANHNSLSVIYRVVGAGTKELASYKPGQELNILGPLGNGFPLVKNKRVLIVGGGIGVPPMYFLAKMLKDENDITFVLGFRSKSQIILENELKKYGDVFVATDDGSYGYHGNVLKIIEENKIDFDVIYACGPTRMLEALDNRYCGKKEGYISFEERMACGIGICYGCACKPKQIERGMLRVCKEGPVFPLGVISYDKA